MSDTKPVQEQAEIFSVTKAGAYVQFTVIAPGAAAGFKPGHFIAVAVGGENTAMGLRRAFAIAGATPPGPSRARSPSSWPSTGQVPAG